MRLTDSGTTPGCVENTETAQEWKKRGLHQLLLGMLHSTQQQGRVQTQSKATVVPEAT